MKIIRSRREILRWRDSRPASLKIGFVPTMGFLHSGHLSLIERANKENDFVVCSIFVNPTQFGPREDFSKYPRNEKKDLKLLKQTGCDLVFIPGDPKEIYPPQSDIRVAGRQSLTTILEGRFRPGHFEGVSTVVLKLFQLIQPQRAYFGEKDYQQLQVIKSVANDLFLPVKIVACPTLRERSGLAMSSRNSYLSEEDRQKASALYKVMKSSRTPSQARTALEKLGFKIDYLEAWNEDLSSKSTQGRGRWLAAAKFKGVRLIDNIKKS